MGILIGSIYRVARRTKCAVIMYDYSGYGLSSGKPSERNIYADIETIIQYLVRQKQIDSKSIILYGESIGSVPSIYMASQMSVGGVILQAPLTSGLTTLAASCLRTVVNLNIAWSFDPFPNINRIDKLDCPGIGSPFRSSFKTILMSSSCDSRSSRLSYSFFARLSLVSKVQA